MTDRRGDQLSDLTQRCDVLRTQRDEALRQAADGEAEVAEYRTAFAHYMLLTGRLKRRLDRLKAQHAETTAELQAAKATIQTLEAQARGAGS